MQMEEARRTKLATLLRRAQAKVARLDQQFSDIIQAQPGREHVTPGGMSPYQTRLLTGTK